MRFFSRFYGFFSLLIIESGNWATEFINSVNQFAGNLIYILQMIIGILTIWKLTHELKKARKENDKK